MESYPFLRKPWAPSDVAYGLIREFEGCILKPYRDVKGIWTIGWGHRMIAHQDKMAPITQNEADNLLVGDVVVVATIINKWVYVSLAQPMFDALVSLVYNIGSDHFYTSTLRKCLNTSDYHAAADQIMVWDKLHDQVSHGLMARRLKENETFMEGLAA